MPIPVFFIIFVIFVLWLQYEIRKSKRLSRKNHDTFWNKENESNLVRRGDISSLDYITIPLNNLPMSDREDATINSYRDTILKLSNQKILNLTGLTNVDLKLKYGVANLNTLSEYDNNYTTLVSMLHKWGERLYTHGFVSDAASVLEFAVACFTDASNTYKLLTKIYKEQKASDKFSVLIELIPNTKVLHKDKLINELNAIWNA